MSERLCRACNRPDGPGPALVRMAARPFGSAAMGNLLAPEGFPVIPLLSPALPRMVPAPRYWVTDGMCSDCLLAISVVQPAAAAGDAA